MDGFAVARDLKAEGDLDGPLLVALTGYGQAADAAVARESDFDFHLIKPVRFQEIQKVLATIP